MKRIRMAALLVGLTVGAVALLGWLRSGRDAVTDSADVPSSSATFAFLPGDAWAYEFDLHSTGVLRFGAFLGLLDMVDGKLGNQSLGHSPEHNVSMAVGGRLWFRVLPEAGGQASTDQVWLAGMLQIERFTANGEERPSRALEQPFLLRLDRDGRIAELTLRPQLPSQARSTIDTLANALQLDLPEDTSKPWARFERWQQMAVRSRYARLVPDDALADAAPGGMRLQRRLALVSENLLPAEGGGASVRFPAPLLDDAEQEDPDILGVTPSLLQGEIEIGFLHGDPRWLRSVKLDVEVAQSKQREEVGRSQSSLSLRRLEDGGAPPEMLPGNLQAMRQLLARAWVESRIDAGGASLLATLGPNPPAWRVAEFFAGLPDPGSTEAEAMVLAYLQLYPERAWELMNYLRTASAGKISTEADLALWRLLAQSSTVPAQNALLEAIEDERFPAETRLRAAINLSEIDRPAAQLVDALLDALQLQEPGKTVGDEIWPTKILGLGALGAVSKEAGADGEDDQPQRIAEALGARFQLAADPYEQELLVSAMGNQGHPALLPVLDQALGAVDPVTRRSAFGALRRMPGEEAFALAERHFAREPDPAVRVAAIEAVAQLQPTPKTVAWADALARSAQDPAELQAVVAVLAAARGEHPDADASLQRILDGKPPREVRAAILAARSAPQRAP